MGFFTTNLNSTGEFTGFLVAINQNSLPETPRDSPHPHMLLEFPNHQMKPAKDALESVTRQRRTYTGGVSIEPCKKHCWILSMRNPGCL